MIKITEQDIIKLVSENKIFREEILVPIGEDAGVFFPKQDSNMVVTTDTMVKNTHFDSDITPYELGYIAAASNISDLSAMGANPAFALINLTIEEPSDKYIKELIKGYNAIFKNYSISVLGGDTTCGPTTISMTLIGYTKSNNFMLTSNSKNEDNIFISGPIGNSMIARLNNKYHLPTIRTELGILLPEYANSCTDMSDGILKSLKTISKKSNIGGTINLEKIKINTKLKKLLDDNEFTWEDALSFGEDYELLFTANNENSKKLKDICEKTNIDIYEIGKLNNNNEIKFYYENNIISIDINKNFEHFK